MSNLINMFPSGGGSIDSSKYTTIINVSTTLGTLTDSNVTVNDVKYPLVGSNDSISITSPVGTALAISFDDKLGYIKPTDISYTVTSDVVVKMLNVVYVYDIAYIDVNLSSADGASIIGQTITVGEETKTASSSITRFDVKSTTQYTVSVGDWDNGNSPAPKDITTGEVNGVTNVDMQYYQFVLPTYTGNYRITEIEPNKKGYIELLTSGAITFKSAAVYDFFGVGGGGSGGNCNGGGGGGGYVSNAFKIKSNENKQYQIVIGSGSAANPGAIGGTTEVSDGILRANGGSGGTNGNWSSGNKVGNGGNGGSGGGAGSTTAYNTIGRGGDGGTNGSDGFNGTDPLNGMVGKGAGVTTRAFADAEFPLYAAGGKGSRPGNSKPVTMSNTGNGGSGGDGFFPAGGSGIVIIRWGY